jgi:pyridinium-3,5-bisthiocarboxylic acid mononucleotide nickel chelatase
MKIAYFDCPSGIAGDMCLGALVDAGVPCEYLVEMLAKLGIEAEYHLHFERVLKNGISATKAQVHLEDKHKPVHRHLPEIQKMILAAKLPERVEQWSLKVFQGLAEAEAAVHGTTPEEVHFHEVGATDALVDIVGTCLGLDYLKIDRLVCSALPMGGGMVKAAHGLMPVPTPAVVKLWESRNVPVYSNNMHRELVTPTGAAIVCALAESFGEMPALAVGKVGLGAGDMDLPVPNILRLWLGEAVRTLLPQRFQSENHGSLGHRHSHAHDHGHSHDHDHEHPHDHGKGDHDHFHRHDHEHPHDHGKEHSHSHDHEHSHRHDHGTHHHAQESEDIIASLETQIDDLNPQVIGYLFERLLAAGAVDLFTIPVGMKKNRPGVLLTVLCPPHLLEKCEGILFEEASTLGIRRDFQVRSVLERHHEQVETPYGTVRIKIASRNQAILNAQPEYEDCREIAHRAKQPLKQVQQAALLAWQATQKLPC